MPPFSPQAEEYQDALALSNAVHSLRVDGPLDAAHLDTSLFSPDSAGDNLSDSMQEFNGYNRAHSPMASYRESVPAHDGCVARVGMDCFVLGARWVRRGGGDGG